MARPLRIEFEDAWYHVMNRGLNRQLIFINDKDKQCFLNLLTECHQVFGIEVHSYCLMDNHYHLFLKTPRGNLSRAMRHLNGVYTQLFNLAHKRDGPLFRGRFKAILVDADSYLLQLSRYIHLNSVEAGLTEDPEDYLWSSFRYYMESKGKPPFLETEDVLDYFGKDANGLKRLKEFTLAGIDKETQKFYSGKKLSPIMGGLEFVGKISKKTQTILPKEEIPQSKRPLPGTPELDGIVSVVSQAYEVARQTIVKPCRRRVNEARRVAIYLARVVGGYSLKEIARFFGPCHYSTIGNAVYAVRRKLDQNPLLAQRIIGLQNALLEKDLAVKSKIET